jgi:hypothetical protein
MLLERTSHSFYRLAGNHIIYDLGYSMKYTLENCFSSSPVMEAISKQN